MNPSFGKYIFFAGIAIAIIGIVFWMFSDKLGWFGNLPGDVKVEKENFKFYMPITTMILVSIGISLLLWLFRKIF